MLTNHPSNLNEFALYFDNDNLSNPSKLKELMINPKFMETVFHKNDSSLLLYYYELLDNNDIFNDLVENFQFYNSENNEPKFSTNIYITLNELCPNFLINQFNNHMCFSRCENYSFFIYKLMKELNIEI